MRSHLTVAVVKAQYELLEDPSSLHLSQLAKGVGPKRVGKQIPPLGKLHADSKVVSGEEDLQEGTLLQVRPAAWCAG